MWLTFALLTLATARATRLVTTDSITSSLRFRWFKRFPPGPVHGRRAHPLGVLIDCPWCVSVWLSGAIVAVAAQRTSLPLPVAWWAGVSELTGLIASRIDA